jgi:hypothetical protein
MKDEKDSRMANPQLIPFFSTTRPFGLDSVQGQFARMESGENQESEGRSQASRRASARGFPLAAFLYVAQQLTTTGG